MTNYTREIIKDLAIINLGHEHPKTIEIFSIDEREKDDTTAVGMMIESLEEGLNESDEEDFEDDTDEVEYNPCLDWCGWD